MTDRREAPDTADLVRAMDQLAHAMNCQPMGSDVAESLIAHVLFDKQLHGRNGRNAWASLQCGIITELELRNLLMAHCATSTAQVNDIHEPASDTYLTRDIGLAFEIALLGREAHLAPTDSVDHINNTRLRQD